MAKLDPEPTGILRDHLDPLEEAHGGTKGGAVFFGWLVAVALTILLGGIAGALATAVGTSLDVTETQATQRAGTIGIVSGAGLLVLLMIGYACGGYVAGRMARFNGGRQGIAVWILGLIITAVVGGVGALFGSRYDIVERISLPTVPLSSDSLTLGGTILLVAVLLGTGVCAFLGGRLGERYHTKIDRAPAGDPRARDL